MEDHLLAVAYRLHIRPSMKLTDRHSFDSLSPTSPSLPAVASGSDATSDKASPAVSQKASSQAASEAVTPRASATSAQDSRLIARHEMAPQQLRAQIQAQLDGKSHSAGADVANTDDVNYSAQITPEEGFSMVPGQGLTFTGTSGDDSYTMSRSPTDRNRLTITNDNTGKEFSVTASQVESMTINLGDGNDIFNADRGAGSRTKLNMGDGDDKLNIRSTVYGLEVNGGQGNDTLDARRSYAAVKMDGGDGNDTLYGGISDDSLRGGEGDDQIFGGQGNDQIFGHGGADRIYGDEGDDLIHGGEGSDLLDGGTGSDSIYADETDWYIEAGKRLAPDKLATDDGDEDLIIKNGRDLGQLNRGGNDVLARYDRSDTEAWLNAHPKLKIEGSDDFRERTIADLGAIRFTEQGRQLTNELHTHLLHNNGRGLTIKENHWGGGTYRYPEHVIDVTNRTGRYHADGAMRAPLPMLFHELVHANQYAGGGRDFGSTRLANGAVYGNHEFQATGLAFYDSKGQLRSKDDYRYSENKFRRELGLNERQAYGGQISAPVGTATPRREPEEAY